uniref:Uncharacterized protein n=1 Tax=Rhizophora mucronata TaxID=61149 RepID=A0A2P2NCU3_RHIMU
MQLNHMHSSLISFVPSAKEKLSKGDTIRFPDIYLPTPHSLCNFSNVSLDLVVPPL